MRACLPFFKIGFKQNDRKKLVSQTNSTLWAKKCYSHTMCCMQEWNYVEWTMEYNLNLENLLFNFFYLVGI